MFPKETVLTGADHPGTELMVMCSAAGYYLGYSDKEGMPYSRETVYFGDHDSADQVLRMFRRRQPQDEQEARYLDALERGDCTFL